MADGIPLCFQIVPPKLANSEFAPGVWADAVRAWIARGAAVIDQATGERLPTSVIDPNEDGSELWIVVMMTSHSHIATGTLTECFGQNVDDPPPFSIDYRFQRDWPA